MRDGSQTRLRFGSTLIPALSAAYNRRRPGRLSAKPRTSTLGKLFDKPQPLRDEWPQILNAYLLSSLQIRVLLRSFWPVLAPVETIPPGNPGKFSAARGGQARRPSWLGTPKYPPLPRARSDFRINRALDNSEKVLDHRSQAYALDHVPADQNPARLSVERSDETTNRITSNLSRKLGK